MNGAASLWTVYAPFEERFRAAHIESLGAAVAAGETVRLLRKRSNHVLHLGESTIHLKVHRGRRASRARDSEARGLALLEEAGVRVPTLVCEGRDAYLGSAAGTLDLSPARPLRELLEATLPPGDPRRREVLHDLARQVARLHDAHVQHRSLNLDHVFVDATVQPCRTYLIDAERARRVRRLGWGRLVVKDLAGLDAWAQPSGASRAERLRFLFVYLAARQAADVWLRPLQRAVLRKAARVRAHVPRTPVGPAARPPAAATHEARPS